MNALEWLMSAGAPPLLAEDGTPLSDARANGAQAYCDDTRVRLPAGRVTVEIDCPDFERATVAFEAKEGARVPVKMTPRK